MICIPEVFSSNNACDTYYPELSSDFPQSLHSYAGIVQAT